jgi:ABC-type sugar transport system ATPase subunit
MAVAEFERVSKRFGEIVALDDFSLQVADGEMVAVVGPSGCGKSTLLRITAGLERPSAGAIRVGGRRIDEQPAHARDVAMVFQSYALYPHMTVRDNIEFPLRMRSVPRQERRAQAEQIADALELGAALERKPAELSGGQRQRVALARALVRHPALFLLDEPLSNLDAQLRIGVRQYIRTLQRRLHVTTLYVTHDQTEAMTLGDRVAVLRGGRLQQADTPAAVYERPANAFVAGFIGTPPMNLLQATVAEDALCFGEHRVALPASQRERFRVHPGPLLVGVRPESFDAAQTGGLEALVDPTTSEILGSETLVRGSIGHEVVTIRLNGIVRTLPARVSASFAALHLFAADGRGARLE